MRWWFGEWEGYSSISYQAVCIFSSCTRCCRGIIWNWLILWRQVGGNQAFRTGSPGERDRPLGCIYKQNLVTQLWPLRHQGVKREGAGFLPVGKRRVSPSGSEVLVGCWDRTGGACSTHQVSGWRKSQSQQLDSPREMTSLADGPTPTAEHWGRGRKESIRRSLSLPPTNHTVVPLQSSTSSPLT